MKDFYTEKTKENKKGNAILFCIFASLFLACAVFCVFFFFEKNSPQGEEKPRVTVESTETLEEESITLPEEIPPTTEDDELRGTYIATVSNINFPSKPGLSESELKQELDEIVSISRAAGLDTIFFQVRPSGDALYHSDIFPTSHYLVQNEGDAISFDPFSYLIDKAEELNMQVVAWVNPYRITASNAKTKDKALESLSADNPAKINPDWTVFYGGKLYYNPALPQVRELICSGVKEICENYRVAGVLYDDYFYPYKVQGEVFDDAEAYGTYGCNLSISDWRRKNVNDMVKMSYDTVKSVSKDMIFGISPFGIWQNASSDPKGSDTSGLEAYSELYCDALAWIDGGYIDFISPQIYWERGTKAADFATLTRWWSAQVDGTGVKLYVSHAAYKVADFTLGSDEILQQIEYSRAYMGVGGNILYGFEDIRKNTADLFNKLSSFYEGSFVQETYDNGVEGVSFSYPSDGMKTEGNSQFVSIVSDVRYPIYNEYGKVPRTKSGFSSVLIPLQDGNNKISVKQNGKEYSLSVVKESASSVSHKKLPSFQIASFSPNDEDGVFISSGGSFPVQVKAPQGCRVVASLDGKSFELAPTLKNDLSDPCLEQVYEGNVTVLSVESGSEPFSVGKISFLCEREGESVSEIASEVFVIPEVLCLIAKVKDDYTYLKKSIDSSFYDDFTPAAIGLSDRVISAYNGYCLLSFGGMVEREHVELILGDAPIQATVSSVLSQADEFESRIIVAIDSPCPLNCETDGTKIVFTVYHATLSEKIDVSLSDADMLFLSGNAVGKKDGTVSLTFRLKDVDNYYGFDYTYTEEGIVIAFRQPQKLIDSDLPLQGKTVVLDAGHGGTDTGAVGFVKGYREKDLNLSIVLQLEEKLKSLGADVLLSRSDDSTVSLQERMDFLNGVLPDLSVSVHHNSMNETKDANNGRGSLGLYWAMSGTSLASCVNASLSNGLSIYNGGSRSQKLALCRNHRFPQTLIEVSFICSPAEAERALRSDYATECADAIAKGILDWYELQESFVKEF